MSWEKTILALFLFPGLLYAVPMAWLMLWMERKFRARMQGRIGPPFYQPFSTSLNWQPNSRSNAQILILSL